MFLIFHELRADVLPVDDIGLQNAIALHYNDGERPTPAAMRELALRLAAVSQRRDLVSVALARPDSGRVLGPARPWTGHATPRRIAAKRTMARMNAAAHPYAELTPDRVLDALESVGLAGDGRLQALGSYENRVYQIGIEDAAPVVVKFYRPERWSDAAILEEHAFVAELAVREIPVVAALVARGGARCTRSTGFGSPSIRDAAAALRSFPIRRRSSGWAAFSDASTRSARSRRSRTGRRSMSKRSASRRATGCSRTTSSLRTSTPRGAASRRRRSTALGAVSTGPATFATLRLHGDCHAGNVLWIEHGATRGPHFVDFDDARMGPAVQDLWMLLSGDRAEMTRQLDAVLDGYRDFHEFDRRELNSSRRCARCASSTTRRGSHSAGTIRRFPWRFPGSTRSATGRTASSSCASRSR